MRITLGRAAGLGVTGTAVALLIAYPVLWVPLIAIGYYLLHALAFALPLYAYYEVEYRIRRFRWRRAKARAARPLPVPRHIPAVPAVALARP